MDFSHAVLLGTVQGLAEFLPVSSSGHLVVLQKFLGYTSPPLFFDIALHVGTLIAVVVFFSLRITQFLKALVQDLTQGNLQGEGVWSLYLLFVASLPAFFTGVCVSFIAEFVFNSFVVAGIGFFVTAVLLFWTTKPDKFKKSKQNLVDYFVVGLFQALAVFPGVSRSGSTIAGGLSRGFSREEAFEFSFLLSIPAIVGACVLEILKGAEGFDLSIFAIGTLVSGVVGFFALQLLKKAVINKKLYYFGFYCFALAVVCFGCVLVRK